MGPLVDKNLIWAFTLTFLAIGVALGLLVSWGLFTIDFQALTRRDWGLLCAGAGLVLFVGVIRRFLKSMF